MSSEVDVLFVIPGDLSAAYQQLASTHATEPPAVARFIGSYLLRRGIGVAMIDAALDRIPPNVVAVRVAELKPLLVVVPVFGYNPSSSTHTMPAARAYCAALKEHEPNLPILMLGTHPAALPEQTLREEPVDYVCSGEGPVTVHELLMALQAGGSRADIRQVRSLWYWEDAAVAHTVPAPLLDLNAEPALAGWSLMDPRKYKAHDWHTMYREYAERGPYANPFSSQGCPFRCGFCNIQSPFREGQRLESEVNTIRHLKPELFVEEVAYLAETFGVTYFKIPDEMFGLGNHPLRIAELIRERFGDSLNFWCYYRIDTCRTDHLEALRSAGIRWLALGIEAANSGVRSGQDKKFKESTIYHVVERLHDAGLYGALNYIFGLPGDTMESMQATYALALELNGAFANFYCHQALPGAEDYAIALRSGYPLPNRPGGPGWIGHAQYARESEPCVMSETLTPAQVIAFRDWAQVRYYSRPEFRSMIMRDPNFGQSAPKAIDDWVETVRTLKRALLAGKSFSELTPEEQTSLVPSSQESLTT